MDLPGAMPEEVTDQIVDLIGSTKEVVETVRVGSWQNSWNNYQ